MARQDSCSSPACSLPLSCTRATAPVSARDGQGWKGYDTNHDTAPERIEAPQNSVPVEICLPLSLEIFGNLEVGECNQDVSIDHGLAGVVGNTSTGFSQLILNGPIP